MIYIYYLEKDGTPFYIGRTKNVKKRERDHKLNYGEDIKFNIIDEVEINDWRFWEKFYIELFKQWGFNLLNKNSGGGGPLCHTQETKDKISKKLMGRIISEETNMKKSQSMLNGGSIKVSKALKGKPNPKLSLATKGKSYPNRNIWRIGKLNPKSSQTKTGKSNLKSRKPILQYDKQGNFIKEWDGISIAMKETQIKSIAHAVNKNLPSKTAGGYIWKYKNSK